MVIIIAIRSAYYSIFGKMVNPKNKQTNKNP